jgi:hypothetical protein
VGTTEARIKGVYDLLVKREDQANYCGRGKGFDDCVVVPEEIFGALCGELFSFFFSFFVFFFLFLFLFSFFFFFFFLFFFPSSSLSFSVLILIHSHALISLGFFTSKMNTDASRKVVEAINQKGAQARRSLKPKGKE